MKTYVFARIAEIDGRPVDTSTDCTIAVINGFEGDGPTYALKHRVRHSPTGMNWGYSGSGPADCARSLAWDVLGRDPSPREYQHLKERLIATMPVEGGVLTEQEVRDVLGELPKQEGVA